MCFADIATQHVGREVLSSPRLPVKRNEFCQSTSRDAHRDHVDVVTLRSPLAASGECWRVILPVPQCSSVVLTTESTTEYD